MEHKKSQWHKKGVGGTKKESVEQNQSRPGIFKESVPYPLVRHGLWPVVYQRLGTWFKFKKLN